MKPQFPAAATLRSALRQGVSVLLLWAGTCPAVAQRNTGAMLPLQTVLTRSLGNSAASAVVLRWSDGAVVARVGRNDSATPGSAIKPLILAWALGHGNIARDTAIYCRRSLRIGNARLACTHPADTSTFTAEMALAASCNTYFAALADRMPGADLEAALQAAKLPHEDATNDAQDEKELTVLGLRHVAATPLQLAAAYRALMLSEPRDSAVLAGLADSVRYGMANGARVDGVAILGKTGTASTHTGGATHGWFAGAVPGSVVLVLFVPQGNGGDAALLASKFFRNFSKAHSQ